MQRILLLLCILFLAGCNEQALYSQLSEQEVNEMIVVLQQAGISAQKSVLKEGEFAVTTQTADFNYAVSILSEHGYPKKKYQSLCDVFPEGGLVNSPLAERARLDCARSQELTQTLETIDGVVSARVHLAIPKKDPLSDIEKQASASIFIKHRRGIDLSSYEGKIKGLVVDGIEGLPYENVTIALFPTALRTQQKPLKQENTNTGEWLSPNLAILLMLPVFLFVLIGWFMLQPKKPKTNLPATIRPAPARPAPTSPAPGRPAQANPGSRNPGQHARQNVRRPI